MTHIAEMANIQIDKKEHNTILNKILNLGAWLQVLGGIFVIWIILYVLYRILFKKKSISSRNRGWK